MAECIVHGQVQAEVVRWRLDQVLLSDWMIGAVPVPVPGASAGQQARWKGYGVGYRTNDFLAGDVR